MAAVIERLKAFHEWAESTSDPRTKDLPFVSSPLLTYGLVLLYLLFVWQGPRFMAKRKPFDLRWFMTPYNGVLVAWNGYIFYELLMTTFLNPGFSPVCQPVDYSQNQTATRLARACYLFFLSKLVELIDTVVFILRKKTSQVTFLHVYHHATMPMLWFVGVRWIPGGESYFSATLNSFIHVAMYTYYLLAAVGPRLQPYLWWKRYLTTLQLIQFLAIIVHTSMAIYVSCGFPNEYNVALILYGISHILLFGNFYNETYVDAKKKRGRRSEVPAAARPAEQTRYNLRRRSTQPGAYAQ
ncbi:hypothetical protein Bbelb_227350 [Branchiostoma belcheri]|nr:hypothetical protein Bbelb_227350 [Branchiostoma belcheri]